MTAGFNRRGMLCLSAAAGVSLALPARALTPPATVPATADGLSPYERRILEVAAREKDRVAPQLWRTDVVGIADFGVPSWKPRLHFASLEGGTVRSFLTAHGKGSDREHDGWLKAFSNTPGSEATSRGAYLTAEWYKGKYGTSIRLLGLDADNATALDRAIVMHSAWYAEPAMVAKWGKIGRSEGCFAMAPDDFREALWRLSGGRLLFADRIGDGTALFSPNPNAPPPPPAPADQPPAAPLEAVPVAGA
jgi:hypothetical protein